jgi:hypothetical protein
VDAHPARRRPQAGALAAVFFVTGGIASLFQSDSSPCWPPPCWSGRRPFIPHPLDRRAGVREVPARPPPRALLAGPAPPGDRRARPGIAVRPAQLAGPPPRLILYFDGGDREAVIAALRLRIAGQVNEQEVAELEASLTEEERRLLDEPPTA